MSYINCFSND